jgi:L-threonylcarbamoyladenylate synthase
LTILRDENQALSMLMEHEVVAVPTETVYGLAGWIQSEKAIQKIFSTKKRPFFDPLIVHVKDAKAAQALSSNWTPIHELLAKTFWPGPLTIIAVKNHLVNPMITAGLDKVGLRSPKHLLTQKILDQLPLGFAAPSANIFMQTSPTDSLHVEKEFEGKVSVLEGGTCPVGIESTVIEPQVSDKKTKILIYRPGSITKAQIENALSAYDVEVEYTESPVAPGQLKHHYVPKIPVLIQEDDQPVDLEALSKIINQPLQRMIIWPLPTDPAVAARLLYQKFREFSSLPADGMMIQIKSEWKKMDDWQGILNRLSKASITKI